MNLYTVNVSAEALAASTSETVLQVLAGTKEIEIVRFGISFNGTTPSNSPVQVDVLRQGSAGTSSTAAPLKLDINGSAALATGLTAFTAEPTPSDVIERYLVTEYQGLLVMQYAPDERIHVPAAGRLGIRVLPASSLNVSAFIVFAE